MKRYSYFTNRTWSNKPKRNRYWLHKINKIFGLKGTFSFVRIEDKMYGAAICYSILKHRSETYDKALKSFNNPIGHTLIKKNHIYEYFFFTCCNYIYQELFNLQKHNKFILPRVLISDLLKLKEERRAHEHGKEWSWGEKGWKPVPHMGINYDFEKNMELLNNIYECLINKIKNG